MAESFLIHRHWAHVDGRNVAQGDAEHVTLVLEPELQTLGEARTEPYGYTIALRQWDPQVFLHEWLHLLVDQHIPFDGLGGFNHRVINTIEVGLQPILPRLGRRS